MIALTAGVVAGAIGIVAVKRGQNGPYTYRHQIQLWPNPDPIDGSSANLHYPIEFSPDGRVAVGQGQSRSHSHSRSSTGQITRIVSDGGDNLVDSMAFAKDGRSIVLAGAMGQVNVRDVATGDLLRTFRLTEKTRVVTQIADVTAITYPAATCSFRRMAIRLCARTTTKSCWKFGMWKRERLDVTLTGIAEQNVLAISPAGNVLALADLSHKISLRRIQSPANRPLIDAAPGFPVYACFSPDETILATGCGREIEFWADFERLATADVLAGKTSTS